MSRDDILEIIIRHAREAGQCPQEHRFRITDLMRESAVSPVDRRGYHFDDTATAVAEPPKDDNGQRRSYR